MSTSSMLRVPVALFVSLYALTVTTPALADISADDVIAQMTQLNKEAVTAYQAHKFDDARKLLKQALDLAPTAALEAHPITARSHIHMGIVLVAGLKQRDNGIKEFQQAIGIQADIALTKSLVTPEVEDAFKEAKEAGGIKPPAPPPEPALPPLPPKEPPPPAARPATEPEAPASGIAHEPVTQGKQGDPIPVTVTVQKDLTFDKLVLAYRPDGATDFLGREMKEQGGSRYGADIPATATLGSIVSYYIEAQDADGNAVAARGSVDNPMVVHLSGIGAPKKEEEDEGEEEAAGEAPDYRYFVGLMLGSGFGWATGNGDTNADVMIEKSGMSLAKAAQIAPEFGYWLNETLMLSVQLRYQVVTGTTPIYSDRCGSDGVCHTANYALAGFAKATWMYGDKKLHPFFSLSAGVGRIRHVVKFTNVPAQCGPNHDQICVDTIGAGPVLVGPGAGVMYDLTESLGLLAQVNSVLGFPDFTANIDANIGVAYQF